MESNYYHEPCSVEELEEQAVLLEAQLLQVRSRIGNVRGTRYHQQEDNAHHAHQFDHLQPLQRVLDVPPIDDHQHQQQHQQQQQEHHNHNNEGATNATTTINRGSRTRRLCSVEGCTTIARTGAGGFCRKHGALPAARPTCSFPDCINQAQKGGVCVKHGAKVTHRKCTHEGCTKWAQQGGKCVKHGAVKAKTGSPCGEDGCGNLAQREGLCSRHWREKYDPAPIVEKVEISVEGKEGSNNEKPRGERQRRLPTTKNDDNNDSPNKRTKRTCSHEGCTKWVQRGGKCRKHGPNIPVPVKLLLLEKRPKRTCTHEGCTKWVQRGGKCYKHGTNVTDSSTVDKA